MMSCLRSTSTHNFVPAALGNVITEANADAIAADMVIEGANGPTTSRQPITILADRDIAGDSRHPSPMPAVSR